jgi:hypothetical protein
VVRGGSNLVVESIENAEEFIQDEEEELALGTLV